MRKTREQIILMGIKELGEGPVHYYTLAAGKYNTEPKKVTTCEKMGQKCAGNKI